MTEELVQGPFCLNYPKNGTVLVFFLWSTEMVITFVITDEFS